MVEIPSYTSYGWNVDVKTYEKVYFHYSQEYNRKKPITVSMRNSRPKNVLNKNRPQDIEEKITDNEPSILGANFEHQDIFRDQKLNSIFQMCLESHGLGDRLTLTSPKNFVVQHFSVSRNHPIKSCLRSQCPFAAQDLRTYTCKQQSACSELPRCEPSQITKQDKSSHCSNPPKEIHDSFVESITQKNFSQKDHGIPCNSLKRRSCSFTSSTSNCTSKISASESLRTKKRHTSQQTEPEQSWQSRCSNFIINLPVNLADKLFGPRITCEALKDAKRTICHDDSESNRSQPVSKDFTKSSSKDRRNKKSVKLRVSSLAGRSYQKNIKTNRVRLEKANQVDPCHSRTSQSVQKGVTCRNSIVEYEKSKATCEKVTAKCDNFREDSSTRLKISANPSDRIHFRGSDLQEPRFRCGTKNQTSLSISEQNKRGKISPSFSNWSVILSDKLLRPRNEKILVGNEVKCTKVKNEDVDGPGIVSKTGSPTAVKKGRLLLKKYTISQTPETMKETLCFDVLANNQFPETRDKLPNHVLVQITNGSQHNLKTSEKSNDALLKCLGTGKPHASKRRVKSRGNISKSSSRKTQQLEKNTSTQHIFFSNLITKLLNRHKDDRDVCKGKRCHRNTPSGQDGNKRDRHARNCAFKRRNDTVSRKYATTSIHKHRNKQLRYPKYMAKDSRRNQAVFCSFEKKVSLDCCTVDISNVSGKDQALEKLSGDCLSRKKDGSEQGTIRKYSSEEDLENVRDSCKNVTQIMTHDVCGSSMAKSLVKSGILQVIDKSCRTEPKDLCFLHRKKPKLKSNMREKCCKRISSPNEFAHRARRQNRIENNDLHMACRSHHGSDLLSQQRKGLEEGICIQRHRDRPISKKGSENYDTIEELEICRPENNERNDVILSGSGRRSKKQCQILTKGTRRTSITNNGNTYKNIFYDCETSTDDLPRSKHYNGCKCSGEQNPNQELLQTQNTDRENMEKVKNCLLTNHESGQDSISNVSRNVTSLQGSSQSISQRENSFVQKNDISSKPMRPENMFQIRVGCEEYAEPSCKNDACRVRPERILRDGNFLEIEHDAEKVLSLLTQEVCAERENTVCGNRTEEGLRISQDDELCQKQNAKVRESPEADKCSASSMPAKNCDSKEKSNSANEPGSTNEGTDDSRELLKLHPIKNDELNRDQLKTDNPEKRSIWIKSKITKLESRNIINSYYSREKREEAWRCEARNDEYGKVKKVKVQRDCSALNKSITKARKPFQRIENAKQVGRIANVIIKNDKSKKRNVVEKENSIVNKKAQFIQDECVFDNKMKNYLLPNMSIENSSLPNGSIPTDNCALSIQVLKRTDSMNPETHSPASEIPKKSGPLTRKKTPPGASTFFTKAPESSNAKRKERLRKSGWKKEHSGAASSKTDAKETAKGAAKILERAESESSHRLARSIDDCDARDSEGYKQPKTPACVFKAKNAEARILQIEMSSVEAEYIPIAGIINGTSRIERRRENSKSSELPSPQRYSEQQVDDIGWKKLKGNKQMMENQSELLTESKENEKDKKSTLTKLLSQNDFEIDVRNSTQESVTTNADLFADALMDGKNNIKSYRDLQLEVEGNLNSNRISTSKDEGLRKSGTATAPSKPKVLKSPNSSKSNAKKTPEKSKNEKKSKNSKESTARITETFHIADKATGKNVSKRSPENGHKKNSYKGLKANSRANKADVTKGSSSIDVGSPEACRSMVPDNNQNHERNVELESTARNSNEDEHLEEQHLLACKNNLIKNSIAIVDGDFENNYILPTAENGTLLKNVKNQHPSSCTLSRRANHEELSCEFRAASFQTNSDSNQKTKQEDGNDNFLRRESPPCKFREGGNISKSNYTGESKKSVVKVEKRGIHCGTNRKDTGNNSKEGISVIRASSVSQAKCTRSSNPKCSGIESKKLCEGFENSSNEKEKEIVQHEYDNVPEKLPACDSEKIISDSWIKNFCFTDDLKRFLDQGQEFFTAKKRKNSNQRTVCPDGKHEQPPCASGKFEESKASCKKTEFCKSVDCQKLKKSSGICDEEQASNNSVSSLQKVYSTLKTILNGRKNIQKGFMNAKKMKETQIYESSMLIEDCVKHRRHGKSTESKISEGNKSLTVSISFGSSIFSNPNLSTCSEKNKKL